MTIQQQRNSHDEYLVNKKNLFNKKGHLKWKKSTSNQGEDMIFVHHLGQSATFSLTGSRDTTQTNVPH